MYDVIVVGARCAGASTALLLARRGYRVVLIDKSTFPSELVMSTHLVWQPGVAKLFSWGLGDALVAADTPGLTRGHFDFGPVVLDAEFPAVGETRQAYAPRRAVLDQLLVQAATSAGADLWEATTVESLHSDSDGAVTGIRATARGGATVDAHARIVVGADGTHSVVARLVDAAEYDRCPPLEGTYFTYWSGVPTPAVEVYPRPGRVVYGWDTTGGQSLIGVNWVGADFPGCAPISRATTTRSSARSHPNWRNGYAVDAGNRSGSAGRSGVTSAPPTGRDGRWSVMPATRKTPGPPRASPTRSPTPSCSPRPSTRVCPGDATSPRRSPTTNRSVTSRPNPCIS